MIATEPKQHTKSISYTEVMRRELSDPRESEAYLEASLEAFGEDGNTKALLIALRRIAEVKGGMSKLAKDTDLDRANLYRTLSENGNPSFATVQKIITSLGYRLTIAGSESA